MHPFLVLAVFFVGSHALNDIRPPSLDIEVITNVLSHSVCKQRWEIQSGSLQVIYENNFVQPYLNYPVDTAFHTVTHLVRQLKTALGLNMSEENVKNVMKTIFGVCIRGVAYEKALELNKDAKFSPTYSTNSKINYERYLVQKVSQEYKTSMKDLRKEVLDKLLNGTLKAVEIVKENPYNPEKCQDCLEHSKTAETWHSILQKHEEKFVENTKRFLISLTKYILKAVVGQDHEYIRFYILLMESQKKAFKKYAEEVEKKNVYQAHNILKTVHFDVSNFDIMLSANQPSLEVATAMYSDVDLNPHSLENVAREAKNIKGFLKHNRDALGLENDKAVEDGSKFNIHNPLSDVSNTGDVQGSFNGHSNIWAIE